MTPTPEAYRLLHEGAIAFTAMEKAGVRIDVPRLERTIAGAKRKIAAMEEALRADPIYTQWRRRYGANTNIGSRPQLEEVLFNVMQVPYPGVEVRGKAGRLKVDKTALEKLDMPFARRYIKIEELKKVLSTHLNGIHRSLVNGRCHAFFNLNTVITYRPSGDQPNLLNIPIRNPRVSKIIRPCFIASEGHQLLELDAWSAEVCCAADYHRDPRMLQYLWDGFDFHKQLASRLFCTPLDNVAKPMRQTSKSYFVFAQFYGNWYIDCAKSLWEQVAHQKLTTADGTPVYDVLRAAGITRLGKLNPKQTPAAGTFEKHVKAQEDYLWNEEFPVYRDWKVSWYKQYLKRGWFPFYTGFVCRGLYKRNEVINYPVQGSSFHGLLWVLIRLQRWLAVNKMRSRIILQVYDSLLIDAHPAERDAIIAEVRRLFSEVLPTVWRWIVSPRRFDAALCPVEGSGHEKSDYAVS